MSRFEEIQRDEIEFSPVAKDVVDAFVSAHIKHRPQTRVRFFDCGNCDSLHVEITGGEDAYLAVDKRAWKRATRQ